MIGFCLAALMPIVCLAADSDKKPQSLVRVLITSSVRIFDRNDIRLIQLRQRMLFPGILIDDQGHVVSFVGMRWPDFAGPDVQVRIQTADGEDYPAQIVGIDERISLAVIEAQKKGFKFRGFARFPEKGQVRFLSLGPQQWRTGAPFLLKVEHNRLVPEHEIQVAGLGKSSQGWDNSIILDKDEKVVGIVTSARHYSFSKTVEVCEVLPADVIRESADRILKTRSDIKAGWLGVNLEENRSQRAVVSSIVPGSPAQKAGLRPGDTIVKAGGEPLDNWQELVDIIRWAGAGRQLAFTVERPGGARDLSAELTQRMDSLPRIEWAVEVPPGWEGNTNIRPRIAPIFPALPFQMGFELGPLSGHLAEFFKCPDGQGLLVTDVMANSLAEKAGFRAGDVLIRVNDEAVASPADIRRFFAGSKGSAFEIQFLRDGRVRRARMVLP